MSNVTHVDFKTRTITKTEDHAGGLMEIGDDLMGEHKDMSAEEFIAFMQTVEGKQFYKENPYRTWCRLFVQLNKKHMHIIKNYEELMGYREERIAELEEEMELERIQSAAFGSKLEELDIDPHEVFKDFIDGWTDSEREVVDF